MGTNLPTSPSIDIAYDPRVRTRAACLFVALLFGFSLSPIVVFPTAAQDYDQIHPPKASEVLSDPNQCWVREEAKFGYSKYPPYNPNTTWEPTSQPETGSVWLQVGWPVGGSVVAPFHGSAEVGEVYIYKPGSLGPREQNVRLRRVPCPPATGQVTAPPVINMTTPQAPENTKNRSGGLFDHFQIGIGVGGGGHHEHQGHGQNQTQPTEPKNNTAPPNNFGPNNPPPPPGNR